MEKRHTGYTIFLVLLLLGLLSIAPASAQNMTNFENFNETIGIGTVTYPDLHDVTGRFDFADVIYQPIEQIYNQPWIPADIFWIFFLLGIGLALLSLYNQKTQVELYMATFALVFMSFVYVHGPFIANIGTATFYIRNATSTEVLNIVQPYSLIYALPGFDLILLIFQVAVVLRWFHALYNFIRYGLLHPEPMMGGDRV